MLYLDTVIVMGETIGLVLASMGPVEKRDGWLALIPTGLYALVMAPLNCFRVISGPYPFLCVHEQPWYVSVAWLFAIGLVAALVAVLPRRVCGMRSPTVHAARHRLP